MEAYVVDDLPPEVVAMVQALYSRDPRSVQVHLEMVKKRGPEKFMSTYYVGYGHKSIGDCGGTAIFVENCSLLVAKAVQDTPLYSGQEASTRYLDMAAQGCVDPLGTEESASIQADWMRIYSATIDALIPALKHRFPLRDGEKSEVWEKAIKARAFDIARSLLVAGVRTYVAWMTNLRQAHDHILELEHHALPEGRDAGLVLRGLMKERYPSSFSHKPNAAQEAYVEASMARFSFFDDPAIMANGFRYENRLDLRGLARHADLLASRPPRTELHQRLRRFGSINFEFPLDFGSWRDLQRQRSAVIEFPLLTMRYGFHPWYLENLPSWVPGEIARIKGRVEKLDCDEQTRQYYIPIGYLIPVAMSAPLPASVYIAELRSGDTVHPTLRMDAQRMGDAVLECVPGIAMHHDKSPGSWNIKRGAQDITRVPA